MCVHTGVNSWPADGWWRRRPQGARIGGAGGSVGAHRGSTAGGPATSATAAPRVLPSGVRVAIIGDSISYGIDSTAPRSPAPVAIATALANVATAAGVAVDADATPPDGRPTVVTVAETERLWAATRMGAFLRGRDGVRIARSAGLEGVSSSDVPMKRKLAIMAERYGVALGWGWPWPAAEPAPPQLAVTPASHLQSLLGPEAAVSNFAVSGTTLLKRGHNPYVFFLTTTTAHACAVPCLFFLL
jgi:hypothetical protein